MQDENKQDEEMNDSLKRHNENAKHEREREEKRQATIKRLKTDPGLQEYLQQFSKSSGENFIEDYAFKLELVLEHADLYEDLHEKESTKYMERAEKCLAEIQMKKLYDKRRLWGANALHIDGVQSSADFFPMAYDVMNCPLLPNITRDEIELYCRYAQNPGFTIDDFSLNWLRVENALHDYGDDLPAWFPFCDLYSGNKVYSGLRDDRFKKEREYWDLAMEQVRDEIVAKQQSGELPKPERDTRPMISSYSYEDVLDFMETFEEPEVVRKFEAMCDHGYISISKDDGLSGEENTDWLNEQVESIMLTLGTMKDFKLPVEANSDWRIALIHAWERYEIEETIKAIPVAYDNYLFRLANKIALPVVGSDWDLKHGESRKTYILTGRKIKGEPEDFNF